jgi:hypothetical protein
MPAPQPNCPQPARARLCARRTLRVRAREGRAARDASHAHGGALRAHAGRPRVGLAVLGCRRARAVLVPASWGEQQRVRTRKVPGSRTDVVHRVYIFI